MPTPLPVLSPDLLSPLLAGPVGRSATPNARGSNQPSFADALKRATPEAGDRQSGKSGVDRKLRENARGSDRSPATPSEATSDRRQSEPGTSESETAPSSSPSQTADSSEAPVHEGQTPRPEEATGAKAQPDSASAQPTPTRSAQTAPIGVAPPEPLPVGQITTETEFEPVRHASASAATTTPPSGLSTAHELLPAQPEAKPEQSAAPGETRTPPPVVPRTTLTDDAAAVASAFDADRAPAVQGPIVAQRGRPVTGAATSAEPAATPVRKDGWSEARGNALPQSGEAEPEADAERQSRAPRSSSPVRLTANAAHEPDAAPAVSRAVQVETAVKLENATGKPLPSDAPSRPAGAPTPAPAVQHGGATSSAHASATIPSAAAAGDTVIEDAASARVMRGLHVMVNQRGGVMTMRLQPPELGQLRVEMSIVRGVVTAQFQPSTPEAQAMLERNLAALRTALESHGLAVDRLSVHTSPHAAQSATTDDRQDQHGSSRQHSDAGQGQSRGRGEAESRHEGFADGERHSQRSFTERLHAFDLDEAEGQFLARS